MLLSELTRKQKLKFLDLAFHMAAVDGDPSIQEKRMLNEKLVEVGDNIIAEYSFSLSDNLEETVEFFMNENHRVRNIVYLNLIELLMIGGFYNTTEYFFLEDIRKALRISVEKRKQMIALMFDYKDLRDKAVRLCAKWLRREFLSKKKGQLYI